MIMMIKQKIYCGKKNHFKDGESIKTEWKYDKCGQETQEIVTKNGKPYSTTQTDYQEEGTRNCSDNDSDTGKRSRNFSGQDRCYGA